MIENWDLICEAIYNKKCILFIGNEFPIEIARDSDTIKSSFSKYISEYLIENHKLSRDENFYLNGEKEYDLCQIASFAIRKIKSTKTLNSEIAKYLKNNLEGITSHNFRELLKLPFTLIIDTNYSDFFHSECNLNYFNAYSKNARNDFYDYSNRKGVNNRVDWVDSLDQIPISSPIVYNLFGLSNAFSSMAVTEFDLVNLLIKIISKDPPLPKGLSTILQNEEYCFLFVGFGLKYRDWYFRILHKALDCKHKKDINSYLLESVCHLHDCKEASVYFEDNYNTHIIEADSISFISQLISEYEIFIREQIVNVKPKAFISYIREDKIIIDKIKSGLEKEGIEVLIDSTSIGVEKWRPAITKLINTSDAFVLVQSKMLKELVNKNDTYVCEEIEIAIEAQDRKRIDNKSKFIMPYYIDSIDSIVRRYEDLAGINSTDMIEDEKFDSKVKNLANEIRLQYERHIN